MSLAGVAKETVEIVDRGSYTGPSGQVVSIRAEVDAAVRGTRVYTPEELARLAPPPTGGGPPVLEVTPETTLAAARRLVEAEGIRDVAALNFASAKNAGGGFLRGAKAQEEDLARCSALYHCLRNARPYYDANRASGSLLYTDHMIYAPRVPYFRDDRLDLIDRPFVVSMLTAPAPNAGEHLQRHPRGRGDVTEALARRAELVLRVLVHHGHRVLVLGAWGCGVFRNDPSEVAATFARLLRGAYAGAFERVVFGVYDRSRDKATLHAFERAFAA